MGEGEEVKKGRKGKKSLSQNWKSPWGDSRVACS
jgi:hypothetical protein